MMINLIQAEFSKLKRQKTILHDILELSCPAKEF